MCNGSCKLYILSLFPCICTECLLRIVSSNYFFPILWECCAIKMPMLRIYASLRMFFVTESKEEKKGGILEKFNIGCVECNIIFPKNENLRSKIHNSYAGGIDEERRGNVILPRETTSFGLYCSLPSRFLLFFPSRI